jgi:hypothetical protein
MSERLYECMYFNRKIKKNIQKEWHKATKPLTSTGYSFPALPAWCSHSLMSSAAVGSGWSRSPLSQQLSKFYEATMRF